MSRSLNRLDRLTLSDRLQISSLVQVKSFVSSQRVRAAAFFFLLSISRKALLSLSCGNDFYDEQVPVVVLFDPQWQMWLLKWDSGSIIIFPFTFSHEEHRRRESGFERLLN